MSGRSVLLFVSKPSNRSFFWSLEFGYTGLIDLIPRDEAVSFVVVYPFSGPTLSKFLCTTPGPYHKRWRHDAVVRACQSYELSYRFRHSQLHRAIPEN